MWNEFENRFGSKYVSWGIVRTYVCVHVLFQRERFLRERVTWWQVKGEESEEKYRRIFIFRKASPSSGFENLEEVNHRQKKEKSQVERKVSNRRDKEKRK